MGAWVAVSFTSDPGKITPSLGVTSHLLSCLEVHVELRTVRRASFVRSWNAEQKNGPSGYMFLLFALLIFNKIIICFTGVDVQI